MEGRCLCACEQVVDGNLSGSRDLQLLEVGLVVVLLLLVVLLHQLVQKRLVLLLNKNTREG